jgi:hypothetical protein
MFKDAGTETWKGVALSSKPSTSGALQPLLLVFPLLDADGPRVRTQRDSALIARHVVGDLLGLVRPMAALPAAALAL